MARPRFHALLVLFLLTPALTLPAAFAEDVFPEVKVRRPFPGETAQAKNIILFIGDGMQLAHEVAGSRYVTGENYGLSFHGLPYNVPCATWDVRTYDQYAWVLNAPRYTPEHFDPEVGYTPALGGAMPWPVGRTQADGYFLNWYSDFGEARHLQTDTKRPATDSAAAGTALATGVKTDPGNIAWLLGDPENGAIASFGEQYRAQQGALFGVVSTVPYNHATPASWGAHGPDRNDYVALGESMLREVKPDVVIGAGHPRYLGGADGEPDFKYIAEGTYNEMKGNAPEGAYTFVERTDGRNGEEVLAEGFAAARAQGKKLFGLFGGEDACFEPPVPRDGAAEVARGAMENPLLHHMVEQTLDYMREMDGDKGFFVMFEQGDIDWANHDNDYRWMVGSVWDLHRAVAEACAFIDQPHDDIDWGNTLLIVTSDHANSFLRFPDGLRLGPGQLPEQVAVDAEADPADATAWASTWRYPGGEVSYQADGHTNEPVMLYAKGEAARLFRRLEGAWYPGTRLIDNTMVYRVCAEAVGLAGAGH